MSARSRLFCRTLWRVSACTSALTLCIGSACPTNTPPLPPTLGAPIIVDMEATGALTGGIYREVVRIVWHAPDTDSNAVRSYTILRNASVGSDTGFSVTTHSIPAGVTEHFDRIDDIVPPRAGTVKPLLYKITSIDTVNQPGDTSETDTFILIHSPVLELPRDSLSVNRFVWHMQGIPNAIRSNMLLWGPAGLVWQAPLSPERYSNPGNDELFESALPDSLWPLAPGTYYWAARVEEASNTTPRQSVTVSEPVYVK